MKDSPEQFPQASSGPTLAARPARTYRRGFSTLGCPALGLAEAWALARRFGVDAIELRMLHRAVDLPALWTQQGIGPVELAARIRALGASVAVLDTSFHLISHTAEEREKLLAHAVFAEACEVPFLRVFDGGARADDEELDAALRTLRWWHECRDRGNLRVDLIVETHDSLLKAAALSRLLAAEPRCRLLWDAHHTWRRGGESPAATWAAISRHTAHVHVKDSVTIMGREFRYVLPGFGEFPMPELRTLLARDGFAGVVCLEWERGWIPDLAPLEEVLAAANNGWW
ncbi:MAG: TIM barrel protein [Opitutae bacterium]|nr:TIM barrel protein [Opitutae bacterium]